MIGETASEVFLLDCYLLAPGKGRLAGYGSWPESVRQLLHQNELAGSGLGGIGSYPMYVLERPWGSIVARRYLDPAESPNREVKYGVGMVVKHGIFSWHGVVVGWDTGCRAEERWMKFADVVSGRASRPPSRRRCSHPDSPLARYLPVGHAFRWWATPALLPHHHRRAIGSLRAAVQDQGLQSTRRHLPRECSQHAGRLGASPQRALGRQGLSNSPSRRLGGRSWRR